MRACLPWRCRCLCQTFIYKHVMWHGSYSGRIKSLVANISANKCFRISLSLQLTLPRVLYHLFCKDRFHIINFFLSIWAISSDFQIQPIETSRKNVCACVEIDYEYCSWGWANFKMAAEGTFRRKVFSCYFPQISSGLSNVNQTQ